MGQGLVHNELLFLQDNWLPDPCFALLQLGEAVRLGVGKWGSICNPGTKEAEAGALQTEGQHGPTQRKLREMVTDTQNEEQPVRFSSHCNPTVCSGVHGTLALGSCGSICLLSLWIPGNLVPGEHSGST